MRPNHEWGSPITIATPGSFFETVNGPFDAVIHLIGHWPDRSTKSFIEARNAFRGALAGRVDAEVARTKFPH